MLVIQLSYSDSRMPVKCFYYFSMSPFWTFCTKAPSSFENERNMKRVRVFSALNKTHPKRRYYLFSFNLNLYLLRLAIDNLYLNTLDREKVQGKGATGSHRRGMKEPHAAREPRVADPL